MPTPDPHSPRPVVADASGTSPSTWADSMLLALLGVVAVYALALVVIGDVVDRELFRPLGFGTPNEHSAESSDHIRLVRGVLGAVILAWMAMITAVARGPLRRREPWALSATSATVGLWFVVDTGFSLAVSMWEHALFNVAFAVAFAVPLWSMRRSIRDSAP